MPSRLSPARTPRALCIALSLAFGALAPLAATAQAPADAATAVTRYQQPSEAMRAVLDAPALPTHSLSPDQKTLAVLRSQRYRQVADLARPALKLAGMRIDPAAHAPLLSTPSLESLVLRPVAGGAERAVALPAGGGFHHLRWSPDSRHFLLNRRTPTGVELWVGEPGTGALKKVQGLKLNTILEADAVWQGPDVMVVLAVPPKSGPAPRFEAPDGPTVQESLGRQSPERTLQDLLKNAQDEAVFAHYVRSQLTRVNLRTGALQPLGEPGLFSSLQAAGTQGQVLTERLRPPFSYQVTWQDFARDVDLRDAQGRVLRALAPVALKKDVPVDGVITGPRQYTSSPGADAAVYWLEALDGGDPRRKVEHRDRLMRLAAPYQGEPQEVHRSVGRATVTEFLEGGQQAVQADMDRERQWLRLSLLDLGPRPAPARVISERSLRDRYKDIGQPLRRMQPNGRQAMRVDDGALWLVGAGASPEGERPFLDRLQLSDGSIRRLFRAGSSHYERPMAVLDAQGSQVIVSRESASEVPQLVLRSGPELAQVQALTRYTDPTPQLRDVQRELVKFKRADGVELSFWLYKPPGYQAGERRPTFVWAYPLEFTDASVAGQVSGSGNRFTSFGGSSPLMLLLDGYVVLMDATMPVVGDPKTVNDSFIAQITSNAQAIIDKAVELGVSSRDAMVVGGHSYGAFMTANLLAHTDLFKAGIARSGAYNRSLTPFGFQSEQRTYWEAQDVYQRLSPFNYADKLKEPLLLIHGDSDDNPGTFPIQSQRFYQALSGTGGHVRYVTLPYEGHGYTARESIGHTLWEMRQWMQRQVGEGKPLN